MTEPAIRQRQAVDLDEFERRLRTVAPTSKPTEDPLAELARLVGQDDPFKQVFAESARADAERAETSRREPARSESIRSLRREPPLHAVPDARPGTPAFAELRATSGAPSHGAEADGPQVPYWERNRATETAETARRNEPLDENIYAAPKAAASSYDDEPWLGEEAQLPPPPEQARPPVRSRRGLYALTGVGALAVITLGVLYTFKGGGVMGTIEPPTIRAALGPAKVAPANPTPDMADQDQDSSVLDRNAADNHQPTKVVTREEQPVDLDQATNTAPVRAEELPVNSTTPTIEPKKVKTVTVRPDGTIVTDDASAATRSMTPVAMQPPALATMPAPAVMPPAGKGQDKVDAAPIPKSATPKSTVRIASTPKVASANGNGAAAPAVPAKPKAIATKAVTPPPADTVDADATQPQATDAMPTGTTGAAASASSGAAGTFAVQLAAPASEQEARDLSSRLQKKFATELSGYQPTIHRADAAGKQVYRVRVGNLTREDAVSLCEKLKAGGGACFIAKN
jgi:SPOR domain